MTGVKRPILKTTLSEMALEVRSGEGSFYELADIRIHNGVNHAYFAGTWTPPANPLALKFSENEKPEGSTLICDGEWLFAGQTKKVYAFRLSTGSGESTEEPDAESDTLGEEDAVLPGGGPEEIAENSNYQSGG